MTVIKKNLDHVLLMVLFGVIVAAMLLLRFFDKGCLPGHDCQTYITMAHSIAPAGLVPHHAVRLLPPLLAHGLHNVGLSIPHSFLLIVASSLLATFYLVYRLFLTVAREPVFAFFASLTLLVWHWSMLIPLKTPYQACDAMVYLFVIATVYCMKDQKLWLLFLVGILGILTRQSCFVLAFFATLQLFVMTRRLLILLQLSLLVFTYAFLTHLYQSEQSLVTLLTPSAQYLSPAFWAHVIQDSHVIFILLPFVPWLIVGWKNLWHSVQKNWYLLCYGAVVGLQPLLAYEVVGYHNFVRLSLQGLWGIALVLLLHTMTQPITERQKTALIVYAGLLTFIWGDLWRLGATAMISIWLLLPAIQKRLV